MVVSGVGGSTLIGGAISGAPKSTAGAFGQVLEQQNSKDDPEKIAGAARQFEGLMVGQLLKSAHGSESEGWLGAGDDDDTSSTAIQMAEEYLGQAIANGGGLGIAKMVVQGLSPKNATDSSSDSTPAGPPARTDSRP